MAAKTTSTAEQLRREFHNVIRRYVNESDLRVVEVLGAIELVKHEFITEQYRIEQEESEEN